MEDFLKKNNIFYVLSKERYKKILFQIQKSLRENVSVLKKLELTDLDYKMQKINIVQFVDVIENLKNLDLPENKEILNRIVFSYYGDPYITLNLCIKAILTHTKIVLAIEDMMLGINKAIVKIVNNVLNDCKIPNLIYIENLLPTSELKKYESNIDKVICIGNKNIYKSFKKENIKSLEFIPYNILDLYCETDEFDELKETMYMYTYENNIEMDIYDDLPIEEAISQINKFGEHNISVILSRNEDSIEKFKTKIKSRKIFVNENPFKNEILDIETKYFL